MKWTKRIFSLLIIVTLICAATGVCAAADEAETKPRIFLAPQSMNEDNEIIVPIYAENIPTDNNGLCGMEFEFAYDTEHFSIKSDESGKPILGTSPAMLVQEVSAVNVSALDGVISASYIDFSGNHNLVLRDGPMFYFTFIPLNPNALWNSDDYYPLRFIPGSVNLITIDKENFSLYGTPAEGVDTYMGGYNVFPKFEAPKFGCILEFTVGSKGVKVNESEVPNDAAPYEKDGEVMLPLRYIAEAVGAELYWDNDNQALSLCIPYRSAYFTMENGNVYINALLRGDLPKAELTNDRSYASVSAVKKFFGDAVKITDENGKITLIFAAE